MFFNQNCYIFELHYSKSYARKQIRNGFIKILSKQMDELLFLAKILNNKKVSYEPIDFEKLNLEG